MCVQVCTGLTEYSNTLPFSLSFFLSFFFLPHSCTLIYSGDAFTCLLQSQNATTEQLRRHSTLLLFVTPPHTHTFPLPHDPERTGQWKATKAWHYHVKRCRGARTCPIGSAWRVRRPSKIDEKKKRKKEKEEKKDSSRFGEVKSCASDTLMNPHINNRANFFFFSPLFFFFFLFFFSFFF